MSEVINNWKGKRVFISLKDNSKYSGFVHDVVEYSKDLILFEIVLETGMKVVFFLSEMIKIEEIVEK